MTFNPKSLHIDQALSNISIAYRPSGFIADIIAPVVQVEKESGKYYVWDRVDTFRTYNDLLAPGAVAETIDYPISNDNYYCEEYGRRTPILWRDMTNADSVLKLEMNKSQKLVDTLMLGREKRVADLMTTLGTYASGLSNTLSGTSQWDNASYTGDPILEIDQMKEKIRKACGQNPNIIIIGADIVPVLTNNAKYKEHYKYTSNDIAGNGLPPVLRGLRVIVPGAMANSSNEGATTATNSDVWWKNIILAYINPSSSPTTDSFSFAYTMRAKQYETRKYNVAEQRCEYIETNYLEDIKVTSNVAGYLTKAVIS